MRRKEYNMDIYLSDKQIEQICQRTAEIVVRKLSKIKNKNELPEMVSTHEAAKILGISDSRMRHIKDRFPHVKGGKKNQGKLLFKRDALFIAYQS